MLSERATASGLANVFEETFNKNNDVFRIMREPVSSMTVLGDFCKSFCNVLEKHATYVIVSGFMVIALGRPRGTEDIDIIIEPISKAAFETLHQKLISNGFVCMQSEHAEEIYSEYLKHNLSVRYTFDNEPLPEMEIKFAKDTLDLLQLKNRVKIPETNLDVWFTTAEANIAYKEEYLKSDKDREDARYTRLFFGKKIKEESINEWKNLIHRYKQ